MGLSTHAKHRVKAFVLRQGRRYPGRAGWTRPYRRWLAALSVPLAPQHIAPQAYRDTIDETERRVERLTDQLRQLTPTWRWALVVEALQALRGVSFITAVGLVTEVGDIRRFAHSRALMAYLGLVPSEYSSGPSVRRGGITKAGNPHARRLLAEAAWAYHGVPRIGRQMLYRQEALPNAVCDIAWKGPAPVDGPLPSAHGPRQGEAEGRDGDCARTDGVHLGDRAGGAPATRVHEAMCRSVRPAASRLAGEPSEPLGTSGSPIRPCRGRGSPRRTTVWAAPNPRISAASTVARTRCRRPDGSEDRSMRTRASATRNAEAGSICSIDN